MSKPNLMSTPQGHVIIRMINEKFSIYQDVMHTEEDTRKAVIETVGGTLKDYWNGNTKNIHPAYFAAYKWISNSLVDEEIVKAYPFKLIDEKKFVGLDHDALIKVAMNKLCDLYFATPDVYIPHSIFEKKNPIKSLFKR